MKLKTKILIWSFGSFFQRKILPVFQSNKDLEIEKVFTKKKIKKEKYNFKIENNKFFFFNKFNAKHIYINSCQKDHYKNIKYSFNKNLNVICEKSLCSNYNQTKKILGIANKKKLKLYCCDYFTHHKLFKDIKKILENKKLGKPKLCISAFGFRNNFKNEITYRKSKKLGASSLLDLGFYPLALEFYLFEKFKKKQIFYSSYIKSKKLNFDIEGTALLGEKNFLRYYLWGYNMDYSNFIHIVFENGEIYCDYIFSKNVNQIKLTIIEKNKKIIKNYSNSVSQERLAFNYYLKNKPNKKYYSKILGLSKLIDNIKR